jgi:hypothetical protein
MPRIDCELLKPPFIKQHFNHQLPAPADVIKELEAKADQELRDSVQIEFNFEEPEAPKAKSKLWSLFSSFPPVEYTGPLFWPRINISNERATVQLKASNGRTITKTFRNMYGTVFPLISLNVGSTQQFFHTVFESAKQLQNKYNAQ